MSGFTFDPPKLKAFVALLRDGKSSSKRRAELGRKLLRDGHITLDELRYVSLAFKQAYVDGILNEMDYTVVSAWLRACVDSLVVPRQRMQRLQERGGASLNAVRA